MVKAQVPVVEAATVTATAVDAPTPEPVGLVVAHCVLTTKLSDVETAGQDSENVTSSAKFPALHVAPAAATSTVIEAGLVPENAAVGEAGQVPEPDPLAKEVVALLQTVFAREVPKPFWLLEAITEKLRVAIANPEANPTTAITVPM